MTWIIDTEPAGVRAGTAIFQQGGNAMDAAAAACLACAVEEPSAVDIGGYVAAGVVLDGKTGNIWSLDGNSVAPAAATEDMYEVLPPRAAPRGINELEYACSVRDDANVYGPMSVGVPGFLAGVGTLWERWGRLSWPDIVQPARECLKTFHFDLVRKEILFKRAVIQRFPETARIVLDEQGPPDLARTLERIAAAGWRDLYQGALAEKIVDAVRSSGGILSHEDMASYEVRVTEPLTGQYRGVPIHTAIAPNGGFSVLDALGELEAKPPVTHMDSENWLRLSKALQHAWTLRLETHSPRATPHGTVHVAAADDAGNLVSITISQGGWFGSCFAVPGTGIILGHGMCRFDPHPGLANSPGPRKRPLNNVCPMILRLPDRDVAIGLRGGRRIVSVATQLAQRIIDLNESVSQVVQAPRLHTIDGRTLEISKNFPPAIAADLKAQGHNVEVPDEVGGAAHGAEIIRKS